MSVQPIVYYPDERLTQSCDWVEDFESEEFKTLVEDLKETAAAHKAHGLAANQIGGKLRVFVVRDENEEYQIYANPVLELEGDLVRNHEGCLSFPGDTVLVERPEECTVTAKDENGVERMVCFDAVESVAVQHENDHLDGVLVVDRISRLAKRFFLKKVTKYQKRYLRRIPGK
jgi:peptide deformylase